jgi:hypothetical protein
LFKCKKFRHLGFFEELGRGRGVVPGDDRSEELEAA